jgi:hypothetical protein
MAFVATLYKDRLNVARKVNRRRGRGNNPSRDQRDRHFAQLENQRDEHSEFSDGAAPFVK